jgi:hypothetical protein
MAIAVVAGIALNGAWVLLGPDASDDVAPADVESLVKRRAADPQLVDEVRCLRQGEDWECVAEIGSRRLTCHVGGVTPQTLRSKRDASAVQLTCQQQ